jgi:hypothetical protein
MAKILDRIFGAFNFGPLFDRHSGSLQKNRLIPLEKAAAADAEYEFADGSSSPANAIIVGVGVGPDASLPRSIRKDTAVPAGAPEEWANVDTSQISLI